MTAKDKNSGSSFEDRILKYETRILKNRNRISRLTSKLDILLATTNAINSNKSTEELLEQYRNTLENDLQIKSLVLFLFTEGEWSCALKYGVEGDYSSEISEVSELGQGNEVLYLRNQNNERLRCFDFLIPVFHDEKPLCYVLIGDVDDDEAQMSPSIKHNKFIQTLTNVIAVSIENKALFNRTLRQERVDTELKIAAEMQSLMVGSGEREYPLYDVATYYNPHLAIGGDFCDFIPISEEEAFICMADVSGKGVSAAFLMASVQAHLKALIEHTSWTLESLVGDLNKMVNKVARGDHFVTIFLSYFHYPSRTLHYINAGHNPPFLVNSDEPIFLEEGTVGIGMLESLPFINKGEVKVARDGVLVLSTDGVLELENEEQEEFGSEGLFQAVYAHKEKSESINDIIAHIIRAMDTHRGTAPYFDDIALLCCRFK